MKEFKLPDIAKNGVPIDPSNPYPEIRRHAEKNRTWDYSEEGAYLNRKFDQFKERFFDGVVAPDRAPLPLAPIAIENLRNKNTLAAYNVVPDEYGLNYRLTLNEQHYIDGKTEDGKEIKVWRFGKFAQCETLLHEMVHHEQQVRGKDPYKPGKITHNKEFTERCEQFGLHPKLGEGYHLAPADGVFKDFLAELGIYPEKEAAKAPADPDTDWFRWLIKFRGQERKGTSTLSKWSCGCQNVRVGTKEFHAQCLKCGNVFVSVDKPHQDIYHALPPEKFNEVSDIGGEINRRQMEEGYKPWEDPKDLTTYLEPYQNDVPYEPDNGDFSDF